MSIKNTLIAVMALILIFKILVPLIDVFVGIRVPGFYILTLFVDILLMVHLYYFVHHLKQQTFWLSVIIAWVVAALVQKAFLQSILRYFFTDPFAMNSDELYVWSVYPLIIYSLINALLLTLISKFLIQNKAEDNTRKPMMTLGVLFLISVFVDTVLMLGFYLLMGQDLAYHNLWIFESAIYFNMLPYVGMIYLYSIELKTRVSINS